jgi:hypothetical protein
MRRAAFARFGHDDAQEVGAGINGEACVFDAG